MENSCIIISQDLYGFQELVATVGWCQIIMIDVFKGIIGSNGYHGWLYEGVGETLNKILIGTTWQSIRIWITKKLFGGVVINRD